MKRLLICLLLLAVSASAAFAQPFTRRSSQEKHDSLKKYYEIPNFKLGGKYDLANPSKWEFGGENGVTLESLAAGNCAPPTLRSVRRDVTPLARSPMPL
jgi:homoserine O-acetyltransferase/O-succinyltransferase